MTQPLSPTFHAINPATGEELEPAIREATPADVDTAVKDAVDALIATSMLPPRWQAELLDTIAAKIMDLGDGLLERGEAETALPRARLTGERARTTNQLKMFAEIVRDGSWVEATIETADPNRKPAPKPDLRRVLRQRGPVGIFGASNFPFAFGAVGGDTASALAAACPVVVKGHPSHPGTSAMFADAVKAALVQLKLPAGLFTLLQGRSHELSGALVKHPFLRAVGFTGSLTAGRALFDLAAARPYPIPVYAEMGSVNPIVIMSGALRTRGETIARDLSASVLLGGGQFCTKPGLIFTVGDDAKFIDLLTKNIAQQPACTMLNQNLRDNFRMRLTRIAALHGVTALAQGKSTGHAATAPSLFRTDAKAWHRNKDLHEEAFGPAAVVVHCDTVEQVIECIDHLAGNLTGTVHANDSDKDASMVLNRLAFKVGRVIVNGYPTGVEVNSAIVHGGPYPATTDAGTTSVGSAAIRRWVRLIAYQDTPDAMLPPALQNANPLKIERMVNGQRTREPIAG
jgi:NADP-dependent aldehyde dehydrogenase